MLNEFNSGKQFSFPSTDLVSENHKYFEVINVN